MPSESGKLVNLRELHFHRIQLSTCVPDSPEDQVSDPGKVATRAVIRGKIVFGA